MQPRGAKSIFACGTIALYAVLLLQSAQASSGKTDLATPNPVLLYVGSDCTLMEWKAADGQSIRLYSASKCPQKLFLQKGGDAAFLIYKNSLTAVNLDGDKVAHVTRLSWPDPEFPDQCLRPGISFVQYSGDGVLEVVESCSYPWDDSEAYLYARKRVKWALKRHITCGRFDPCNVAGALTNGFYGVGPAGSVSRRSSRQLWALAKSGNPYLTGTLYKPETHSGWEEPERWTAQFNFDGDKSILVFTILHGEDTGAPSPVDVSVRIASGEKFIICKSGCNASLLQRYLLVHRYFGKGNDLVDLSTGKTIFKGMGLAVWRY